MLMADEVIIDHDIPHIIIQERPDRTIKNPWSAREVPLIGPALETAKVILEGKVEKDYLFPHYASAGGQDRLSQFLNRRVREHTKNEKHVAHSLLVITWQTGCAGQRCSARLGRPYRAMPIHTLNRL